MLALWAKARAVEGPGGLGRNRAFRYDCQLGLLEPVGLGVEGVCWYVL